MLWNLISWTGWTKDDYVDLFWKVIDVLFSIVGFGLICLFGYAMWFSLAFLAGC